MGFTVKILKLYEDKYVIYKSEYGEHYRFEAFRYGEPWRDLTGDNLIGALIDKIEELESKLKGQINGTT